MGFGRLQEIAQPKEAQRECNRQQEALLTPQAWHAGSIRTRMTVLQWLQSLQGT